MERDRSLPPDLGNIGAGCAVPWLLVGGFNAVPNHNERITNAYFSDLPISKLVDCLQANLLEYVILVLLILTVKIPRGW